MPPEELLKELKKLPPHEYDNVTQRNLEIFQSFGSLGWFHVMHEILKTENLPSKLRYINQCLLNHSRRKQKHHHKAKQSLEPKQQPKRAKTVHQKPTNESNNTLNDVKSQ
jgi:hypothetical protein